MAAPIIHMRLWNNFLELSTFPGDPLPDAVCDLLAPRLSYQHKRFLRGFERYDRVTGTTRDVVLEPRRLYTIDERGRLVTRYGFFRRITGLLDAAGYRWQLQDNREPSPRSNCYEPDFDNLFRHMDLRDGQEGILAALVDHDCGVLVAPTGVGKSYLFLAVAYLYPRAKIVIVIPETDNVRKTVDHLTGYLPNIGQVGGGKRRPGHRITVYTMDSLHHFDGDADIALCDEIHNMLCDSVSVKLSEKLGLTRNYGFTASPDGRADGGDIKAELLFGPQIFHMDYQGAVGKGLILPINVAWHSTDALKNPCGSLSDLTARKRHGIWRNRDRNEVIANVARSLPDDDQVLIMVETTEHAVNLAALLPEFELCYSGMEDQELAAYKSAGLLPDDYVAVNPEIRNALRLAFTDGSLRRVISTDVWSTGVSFNELAQLIRADARGSKNLDTQIPGRTSRLHAESGKDCGWLHDFTDGFDPGFERTALGRRRNYKRHGWGQYTAAQWAKLERLQAVGS